MAFIRTGVIIVSLLLGWAVLKSPPSAHGMVTQQTQSQTAS